MKKIIVTILIVLFLAGCGGKARTPKTEPLPPECDLPGNTECVSFDYDKDAGFSFTIQNNEAFDIEEVNLKIDKCPIGVKLGKIPAGGQGKFVIMCTVDTKSVLETKIVLDYKQANTGSRQMKIGKIFADFNHENFK